MEQDPIAKCSQTMDEWNADGVDIPEHDIELLADMSFWAGFTIIGLPDGNSPEVVYLMLGQALKAAYLLGKHSSE